MELAALDALPQYPPDLDKWIIPKDELVLPAAIYSDGTLIIDDGNDRANLNVPAVLHIECAATWSQERPSQALPGRSSGSTAHLHPEALADCSANSSAVAAKAAEQSAARCCAGSSAAAAGPGAERCRCAA